MNPNDPLLALLAQIDQAIATAPQVARLAWGLYAAFVAEGFAEKQALYLVAVQLQSNPGTAP